MPFSEILKKLKTLNIFQTLKADSGIGIQSEVSIRRTLERERERAMRNDHEYSLILFDLSTFVDDEKKINYLIELIAQRLRVVDAFGWYDKKTIGVVLPYTAKEGAENVASYICKGFNVHITGFGCEVYTYDRKNNMDRKIINHK